MHESTIVFRGEGGPRDIFAGGGLGGGVEA